MEQHKMDKEGAERSKGRVWNVAMHHNNDDTEADEIDLCFLNLSTGKEL